MQRRGTCIFYFACRVCFTYFGQHHLFFSYTWGGGEIVCTLYISNQVMKVVFPYIVILFSNSHRTYYCPYKSTYAYKMYLWVDFYVVLVCMIWYNTDRWPKCRNPIMFYMLFNVHITQWGLQVWEPVLTSGYLQTSFFLLYRINMLYMRPSAQ